MHGSRATAILTMSRLQVFERGAMDKAGVQAQMDVFRGAQIIIGLSDGLAG